VASSVGSHTSLRATDLHNPGYPKYLGIPQLDLCLRDSFRNLNQERQFLFTGIRSRLNHMLTMLSKRTVFTENYLSFSPGNYTRASVNLVAIRDIPLYPSYQWLLLSVLSDLFALTNITPPGFPLFHLTFGPLGCLWTLSCTFFYMDSAHCCMLLFLSCRN
jgi:hypothetical protein